MADMLDPSIAEKLARTTKQIATNTAQIKGNLSSSNNYMAQLSVRMRTLLGHTTGVAGAAKDIAKNINAAARGSSKEIEKSSKASIFLRNTLKGLGAFILSDMIVSMEKLHTVGFAPSELAAEGIKDQWTQVGLLLQGIPTSLSTIVGAQIGLTKALGGTHMFNTQMLEDVTKLNSLYGVSTQTGAKIESMIFRWSDGSQKVVDNTLNFALGLSKATGVPVGALLEDMAKNSGLVARYGADGAKAFLEQSVHLMRMGTTIQEMSQFSDKLVDNFEGSLTATAKIQTFLPGFNMAGIQFAAQFGKEEDVAKQIQISLRESGLKDLNQLPRSLRNMLTSSLGLSQEAIMNLLHPIAPKEVESKGPITAMKFDGWMEKIYNILRIGFISVAGIIGLKLGGNVIKSVLSGTGLPGGLASRLMGRGVGTAVGAGETGFFGRLLGFGGKAAGAAVGGEASGAVAGGAAGIGGGFFKNLFGLGGKAAGAAVGAGETGAALTGAATGTEAVAAGAAGAGVAGGGLLATIGTAIGAVLTSPVALIYAAAMGIYKFSKGLMDGLGILKSFGNALAGIVSLGMWTPFEKAKSSAENLARAADSAAKSTQAFSDLFSAVGGQNEQFAKYAYGASLAASLPKPMTGGKGTGVMLPAYTPPTGPEPIGPAVSAPHNVFSAPWMPAPPSATDMSGVHERLDKLTNLMTVTGNRKQEIILQMDSTKVGKAIMIPHR